MGYPVERNPLGKGTNIIGGNQVELLIKAENHLPWDRKDLKKESTQFISSWHRIVAFAKRSRKQQQKVDSERKCDK